MNPQTEGKQEEANPPTCGGGLAQHAAGPALLGRFIGALADVLEQHMAALTSHDAASRAEREAYGRLALEQRGISERLAKLASSMRGYRDLPMAPHDEKVMANGRQMAAFERYVAVEREVAETLTRDAERDAALLNSWKGASGS